MTVPRTELVRLAHGLTPARLAEVVGHLSALEIAFAYSKMRARRTPGNQAHVTNAKDDPLQLAADAAIAVGLGFDEIETTQRVARNAWSNALACAVGASVGRVGHALPVLVRGGRGAADRHGGLHLLRRDRVGLRHRGRLHRRRRHARGRRRSSPPPTPRAASRCAAPRAPAPSCSWASTSRSRCSTSRPAASACSAAMGVQGTQNGGIDGAPVTDDACRAAPAS